MDLYGYSIMDLSNYKVYDYIPVESFTGHKETFIWKMCFIVVRIILLLLKGAFRHAQSVHISLISQFQRNYHITLY